MSQLENGAVTKGGSVGASPSRCAVQVATAVHDQPGIRVRTVGVVEGSQRGDGAAALGQFEHGTVIVGIGACFGRAVEIAAAVKEQLARGFSPGAAVERCQGGDDAASLG